MIYTYTLSNSTDGVRYVGKTTDPKRRLRDSRKRARAGSMRQPHLFNWMRKVGPENVMMTITGSFHTEERASAVEMSQIKCLRELGFDLTNVTDGGEGQSGRIVSPETRAQISASLRGNKNATNSCRSPQVRSAISKALMGNQNWKGVIR